MRGLVEKRVAITGGARGIGRAAAERFLDEGSRVVIFDRDESALDEAQQELSGLTGAILADVTNLDDLSRGFSTLQEIAGGLDVLINNAGITDRKFNISLNCNSLCFECEMYNLSLHGEPK